MKELALGVDLAQFLVEGQLGPQPRPGGVLAEALDVGLEADGHLDREAAAQHLRVVREKAPSHGDHQARGQRAEGLALGHAEVALVVLHPFAQGTTVAADQLGVEIDSVSPQGLRHRLQQLGLAGGAVAGEHHRHVTGQRLDLFAASAFPLGAEHGLEPGIDLVEQRHSRVLATTRRSGACFRLSVG